MFLFRKSTGKAPTPKDPFSFWQVPWVGLWVIAKRKSGQVGKGLLQAPLCLGRTSLEELSAFSDSGILTIFLLHL